MLVLLLNGGKYVTKKEKNYIPIKSIPTTPSLQICWHSHFLGTGVEMLLAATTPVTMLCCTSSMWNIPISRALFNSWMELRCYYEKQFCIILFLYQFFSCCSSMLFHTCFYIIIVEDC